jgi:predicted ATPase
VPELETITIEGFKSIASIEKLKLMPINVLIGPNGSGKSNFIGVFSFLNAVREGQLQAYVTKAGGADKILHFGSKTTKRLRIRIAFSNEINQYQLVLQPTDADELVPDTEFVYFWNKTRYPEGS